MRNVNKIGLEFIKRHEGFVPHVYLCQAGYPTIGYGHLCLEGEEYLKGMKLTEVRKLAKTNSAELEQLTKISFEYAEMLLKQDLAKAESSVSRLINVPLNDNQFAALVSFTFNLGGGALQRSTLRRKINRCEYLLASMEFHRWVYAGGKKLKGLIKRRFEEYLLFLNLPL